MLTLVEIINRSEQGVTKPFICRADDGFLYYVKGASAGFRALCAEWIAGHLALGLGLPIPPYDFAVAPNSLLSGSARDDLSDLGPEPVFASRAIPFAEELRFDHVRQVPTQEQAMVLLFDCWIGNGDRTLSERGGNPNLLWTPGDSRMHVIDHNLAFEDDLPRSIKSHHVFTRGESAWNNVFRQEAIGRMQKALATMESAWQSMPEEWHDYHDLDLPKMKEMLWRFEQTGFIFPP